MAPRTRPRPKVPPMAARSNGKVEDPVAAAEPEPARDESFIKLPAYQAQEIMNFLGECPANRVFDLINYILAAQKVDG